MELDANASKAHHTNNTNSAQQTPPISRANHDEKKTIQVSVNLIF